MRTLRRAINEVKDLPPEYADELIRLQRQYKADGYSVEDAAKHALRDVSDSVEKELNDMLQQLGMKAPS